MEYVCQFPALVALANLCQVLAGQAQDWVILPDDAMLVAPFLALPAWGSALECQMMERVLRAFLARVQWTVHRNFHASLGTTCGAAAAMVELRRADTIGRGVRHWAIDWRSDFTSRHDPVDVAKALIVDRLASPPTTTELARAVGLSRRVLERRFRAATNESPVDFRSRERVRLVDQLIARGTKVEAATRLAGWKSKKDMYRASRAYAARAR